MRPEGYLSDRAAARRLLNSEAPQYLKDLTQAVIEWADEIAQMRGVIVPVEILPFLPPQLDGPR